MSIKEEAENFQSVLSEVMNKNSIGEPTIFKKSYQILLCENLLSCPAPLGDIFKKFILVCSFKGDFKQCKSSSGSTGSVDFSLKHYSKDSYESELEVTGSPLECVFDSVLLGQNSPKNFHHILKCNTLGCICQPVSVNSASTTNFKWFGNVYNLVIVNPDKCNTCFSARLADWRYNANVLCVRGYIFELCDISRSKTIIELPLLVLCDSKDPQKTLLMGIFRKDTNARIMLTSNGPYLKKEDLPKFQTIKKRHHKCFNTTFEIAAFAHYDILEDSAADVSSRSLLKPCKEGSLAIECSWNNVSSVLQIPAADATCELLVQSVSGDVNTGAFARFRELKLIQALSNCINSGKMKWPFNNHDDQLFERLRSLINGDNRQRPQYVEFSINDVEFDVNFESAVSGNRNDLDFTDELWIILTGCSSYKELTEALDFILKELKITTIPPFICRRNNSTIGKLARNVNKKPIIFPCLDSTTPVLLLLEIGIEKLQKDYIMLFAGLELSPYDNLIPYLQHDKLSQESVHCLEKLHSVLELTVVCWRALQMSKLTLNSIVRAALKYYTSMPFVDSAVLKFPVSMHTVINALEKHEPTEWQVSFLSKCNGYKKQTLLNFTHKAVLEYESTEKSLDSQRHQCKNSYYCATFTLIEDDFMVTKKRFTDDQQSNIKK